MIKQSVNIIQFSKLYNILIEIKSLFSFDINKFDKIQDYFDAVESNIVDTSNSIIIVNKKNDALYSNKKIQTKSILLVENLPIKALKIIDNINTLLIKQKFNFQSKLMVKDYTLNFNSRIISNNEKRLKLTEKEIDIILYLNNANEPQSISVVQSEVWGYGINLETHTVETHIYRLRKKMKDTFDDVNFIVSNEVGYLI
jgi:hypothetical protein